MNAIKFLRGLLLVIAIVFFSCDDEPADPQPVTPVSTATCSSPENVTATRSTNPSMVTVLWATNADQHSWQLQYGNLGFVLGSGTTVYSNAPSKIFAGLSANGGYDFYVRSVCSADQYSDWVGPISVPPPGVILTDNYWPSALQNQWVYSVENVNQQPWKIVSTEVISDNTYYTFQPINGEPIMKIRKSAVGDYFQRFEEFSSLDGLVSGNETIVLKDYLPVNSSWTDTYIETLSPPGMPPEDFNVEIVSTITQRDASLTVPGGIFSNVIVVRRVKTVTSASAPTSISTQTYWFARNHGPIQIETDEDGVITTKKLSAHILY